MILLTLIKEYFMMNSVTHKNKIVAERVLKLSYDALSKVREKLFLEVCKALLKVVVYNRGDYLTMDEIDVVIRIYGVLLGSLALQYNFTVPKFFHNFSLIVLLQGQATIKYGFSVFIVEDHLLIIKRESSPDGKKEVFTVYNKGYGHPEFHSTMCYADGLCLVSCCVSYTVSRGSIRSLLGQLKKAMNSSTKKNKVMNIYNSLESYCISKQFGAYDIAQTGPTCWISTLLCVICQDLFIQGRADIYSYAKGPWLLQFIMQALHFSPKAQEKIYPRPNGY